MTTLIDLISLSDSTIQVQKRDYPWKKVVLGDLWTRWPAFFPIKSYFSQKICDHHVISRKKEATEKCSAKYMLFLKYFYNVATLSQFRSWYELFPYFTKHKNFKTFFKSHSYRNNQLLQRTIFVTLHIKMSGMLLITKFSRLIKKRSGIDK